MHPSLFVRQQCRYLFIRNFYNISFNYMKVIKHEAQPGIDTISSKYLNPDWNQAANHGMASRIGFAIENKPQFCNCCFHHINKEPLHLSQDTKELQFLGFGFPLYYSFVRNCIFLLLVMVFCYNIPSLYYALVHNRQFCETNLDKGSHSHSIDPTNTDQIHHKLSNWQILRKHEGQTGNISKEEAAHQIQCTGWMIYLSRIEKQVTTEEQLIRFGSFFVHFILLLYIRDRLTKMKYYFDERSASPSDFAVFIKNMPSQQKQQQTLRQLLRLQYGDIDPKQVLLVPDLKIYEVMQQKQRDLLVKLQHSAKDKKDPSTIRDIEMQIQQLQIDIKKYIRQDKKKLATDDLEAQRAILIFNTQDQKWELINKFEDKPLSQLGWSRVKISEAAEPEQVNWANACYNSSDKAIFKLSGWLLSILTLVLITIIFGVISHFKSDLVEQRIIQYQKDQQKNSHLFIEAFSIVLGAIFLIVLFNKFVLSHLLHKFTQLGKHSSTYKFQFYYCLKYCLGLFFTTALMTLIIEDFIFHNFFKHNFGVIEQQTIMFLFNSTFVPLLWLINPTYLKKRFQRWRHAGNSYMTQKQANSLMQNPVYDIGKRYGEVLEIMWFTFLYMTLIPIGGVFSCIGLIAYYWVDKYNLLRRSTIVSQVSGDLINLTLSMLQFTLILRILGQILFDYQLRGGVKIISWGYLTIAVVYWLLPAELLVNILNSQKFFNQKMRYDEAELFFKNTYKDVHILFNRLDQDHQAIVQKKTMKKSNRNAILKEIRNKDELTQKREQGRINLNS